MQSIGHSITYSAFIPGGQNSSNRQTVFFLLVDPMDKEHKDPDTIDLEHHVLHSTCIRHGRNIKNTVYWVDNQTCSKERIEVLSDTIERYHSSRNTPSLLYSESCSDGNWRSLLRKSVHVSSTSAKDLIETRMEKRIGLES